MSDEAPFGVKGAKTPPPPFTFGTQDDGYLGHLTTDDAQ